MNSERFYLKISIIGIASGIILGAFGAHGLKELLSNYEMDIWNKGIFYQISNFLGLFIMIILKRLELIEKPPYLLLTLGIIMFSFSLYTIALNNVFLESNQIIKTFLIPVTQWAVLYCFLASSSFQNKNLKLLFRIILKYHK